MQREALDNREFSTMEKNDLNTVISQRPATQARGRARRERLLKAAAEVLAEKDLDDITFNEVAQRARIPKGSAYHFYANVMELYSALTDKIGDDLIEYLQPPYPGQEVKIWEDIVRMICKRAEQFYRERPDARELLIGGKTPPQYKRSDRENDRLIGAELKKMFEMYYVLPSIPNELDVFFYTIEIIDLFYCLSMIRHNEVTEEMGEEAILAATSYLRNYLPVVLPRRPVDDLE